MRSRKRTKIENSHESTFELDLAPMLALMVTLIPIMLLSTAFVKIVVIETPLPQIVQNALDNDRKKKDREISVVLQMKESGFTLQVTVDGRVDNSKNMPKNGKEWDFEQLHGELVLVKRQHPSIFRLDLRPSQTVKYSDIVRVMDEARKIKDAGKKVIFHDKKTNENVATDIMFPDVVFANVVEG